MDMLLALCLPSTCLNQPQPCSDFPWKPCFFFSSSTVHLLMLILLRNSWSVIIWRRRSTRFLWSIETFTIKDGERAYKRYCNHPSPEIHDFYINSRYLAKSIFQLQLPWEPFHLYQLSAVHYLIFRNFCHTAAKSHCIFHYTWPSFMILSLCLFRKLNSSFTPQSNIQHSILNH